jgi:hypothetical protein
VQLEEDASLLREKVGGYVLEPTLVETAA